jgi:hypothetical protein
MTAVPDWQALNVQPILGLKSRESWNFAGVPSNMDSLVQGSRQAYLFRLNLEILSVSKNPSPACADQYLWSFHQSGPIHES